MILSLVLWSAYVAIILIDILDKSLSRLINRINPILFNILLLDPVRDGVNARYINSRRNAIIYYMKLVLSEPILFDSYYTY